MKTLVLLFLMATLTVAVTGCKNASKTDTDGNVVTDSLSMPPSGNEVQEVADVQTQKPFKGVWKLIEEGDNDEESGQSFGRYEVILDIDFYDRKYTNTFWVANDRHEGINEIISFKIQDNEAYIRYQSLSGAIFSGKLKYNPKDKSIMLIDGKLLDEKGIDEWMILDWQILRGDDILKFVDAESKSGALQLEGTLSKSKIKMQLNIQGAEVYGTYCYARHNIPIILIGKVVDGLYTIDEFNDGNNTGTFTLTPGSNGTWTGYWSNGEKKLPVNIKKQ